MSDEQIVQVQVVGDDRAALQAMVDDLVAGRLIACGQILGPIDSTFFWEDGVQKEQEWLALLKTSRTATDSVIARLAEIHSYDVPEILVVDVETGFRPYLDWVRERTKTD